MRRSVTGRRRASWARMRCGRCGTGGATPIRGWGGAPARWPMPDARVRYGSSAGKLGSDALRALRNRGRNPDPGETLAYLEFAAPRQACEDPACEHKMGTEGCALDDEDLWWQANSGLWYRRLDMSAMRAQRRMLSGAPEEFTREFLSWWDEPGAADA